MQDERKRFHRQTFRAAFVLAGVAAAGCAMAPRGQIEEAHGQIHALRTELAQTKDSLARLRTENRDMSARAVEDARRITALEASNARLEKSVAAYQVERDQYASALEQIRSAVAASNPPTRR